MTPALNAKIIKALDANGDGKIQKDGSVSTAVVFNGLPFGTPKLSRGLARIDESASDYGRGLQEAAWEEIAIQSGSVRVPLILPAHGSAQLSLWPAYPQR